MENKKINIGILGTANIAKKFMSAQKSLGNISTVVAIASRSLDTAKKFASDFSIPTAYGSYQELVQDPNIQLVYIPLPTSLHKEWTMKCAAVGKHVICEKPLAPTYEDALEMINECKKYNVQFMDGTYWIHSARTKEIQTQLSQTINVSTISTKFTWSGMTPENIRRNMSTEPLGALGDLGWYCIGIILFGFNHEIPDRVFGKFHKISQNEPNFSFTGLIWYNDGRSAHFDCSFGEQTRQWVEFSGEKSALSVDDFVLPWNSRIPFGETHVESELSTKFRIITYPSVVTEKTVVSENTQETVMILDMCRIISEGRSDSYWPKVSLKTHLVLHYLLKSSVEGVVLDVPKELGY